MLIFANFRHNNFLIFLIAGFNMLNMINCVSYHNTFWVYVVWKFKMAKMLKKQIKWKINPNNMLIFAYFKTTVEGMKKVWKKGNMLHLKFQEL